MADERLGASFSIDVTDLKTGLAQANRLIKESQSEFKAAASGMDDWTKSEDGLKAKIKSLTDITEIQKTKVSALKSEYQRLIDDGLDPTSAEAVKLRTKINDEEAALASNEKELKRQEQALNELGEESEETGTKYEKLGEIAKNVGKVAATAIAAAAAGIVAITKQAVESYADYEQLVGGVETLFKDNADSVMKYASNAYKTAGMSANEYMETVTGMSASLIQSLGGDTEKAAEAANMAITDMSDNANKMGTDLESLKNAYGGFAKGQYNMLDNLKIGYGGTAAEMQRLLDDATKLSGIEYDINSYADIVDAIHVVQTELGITGTTAKEASTTIQGSIATMKGAWTNLLTGLADENADLDALITNLLDSVSTVASNLIPRVKVVLMGIVDLAKELIPQLPALIQDMLPEMLDAASSLLSAVVEVLPGILETLSAALPGIAETVLSALTSAIPQLLETAITFFLAILDAIPSTIDALIEHLPTIIETVCDTLVKALPQVLQAAIKLLMAVVQAIPAIVKALVPVLPSIINTICTTLIQNLPLVISAAVQLLNGILAAIPMIIESLIPALPSIINTIFNALIDGLPTIVKAGGQLLSGLFKGLLNPTAIWNAVKSLFNGIVGGIKSLFGIHSPSTVMADVIGKNLALGIGVGFKDNIDGVNKMIGESMNFGEPLFGINGSANNGRGAVVVNQYNTYSQAHSRYELYRTKQQTAAAVRLAVGSV